MKLLSFYSYPGNIRELRNILERARLFTDDGIIRVQDLPAEVRGHGEPSGVSYRRQDDGLEKLAHALRVFKGSRSELAQELGLSERTLYRRLRALGI
ncbi:Helix-turn-helix, Fis-type [Pseudomonas coronafaciens pv. atropurpurea]|nr:Helix-turn-helix, Fis-type [Pseudomonas coronafaciens pv. atropurpurea]